MHKLLLLIMHVLVHFSTLHLNKFEQKDMKVSFIPHKTQPYTNTEDTHTSTHTSIQYFLFPIPSCLSTESLAKCFSCFSLLHFVHVHVLHNNNNNKQLLIIYLFIFLVFFLG